MRKRTLFFITGILVLVVIILTSLFQYANLPNRKKNGFTRNWLPGMVELVREKQIQAPLEKFAGGTASHYFFSVPNPQGVIVLDSSLMKQDTMVYGLPLNKDIFDANSLWIDSPAVYFFANNVPALYRGRVNDLQMDSISLGMMPFTRAVWISPDHIVLRTITPDLKGQVFQKIDSRTGEVKMEAAIIPSQRSGGFDSDGTLVFDKFSSQLFYVQTYSNRIYCLDTNLTVRYTARTIDTTHSNLAEIERIKYKDGEKITPASSRVIVNQTSCTGNGYLFVVSGLKADNESKADFISNNVVDRYRIGDGQYAGSFYLPHVNDEKIQSIWVREHLLGVLYKTHLSLYRLSR